MVSYDSWYSTASRPVMKFFLVRKKSLTVLRVMAASQL